MQSMPRQHAGETTHHEHVHSEETTQENQRQEVQSGCPGGGVPQGQCHIHDVGQGHHHVRVEQGPGEGVEGGGAVPQVVAAM